MPIMTKRVSADEAQAKRQGHTKETGRGLAIVKAMKAPPSWDSDTRSARFVMTSQAVDRYRDIVVTEGVDTTEFERNPVAPLCHNTRSWPIGSWANLEKILRGRPPRMEGDLILLPAGGPVSVIDEAEWMLANGGIRACSIGFVPDWDQVEMILDEEGKWTGGFRFNKSELVECSPCVVPANPDAVAKMAGGDLGVAREMIEDILDNWARSPAGLLMPRADFEKAYKLTVEEIAADKVAPSAKSDSAQESEGQAPAGLKDGETAIPNADEVAAILARNTMDEAVPGSERIEIKRAELNNAEEERVAPEAIVIPMTVDASHVDAEIMRVGGLLDGLSEKIAKVFGRKAPAQERIEPKFEEPPPPSPEAIAAAKQKATETLTRLREAGRIA